MHGGGVCTPSGRFSAQLPCFQSHVPQAATANGLSPAATLGANQLLKGRWVFLVWFFTLTPCQQVLPNE